MTGNRSVKVKKKNNTTTSKSTGTAKANTSMAGNSYSASLANTSSIGMKKGSPSFSDIQRTISGKLATGDKAGADALKSSVISGTYGRPSSNQIADLNKLTGVGSTTDVGAGLKSMLGGALGGNMNLAELPETPEIPEVPELEETIQQTAVMPTFGSMPTLSELPTFDSEYLDQLNALAEKLTAMNYDDWTQGDQYQSLAGRYGDAGKLSMQDVLGQIASRTGGMASSYATSAAQQQYNDYMAKLEDVARSLYSDERNDMMNNFSTLRDLYSDEYQRYRDTVNDEYQRYRDSVEDYLNMLSLQQKMASAASSGGGSSGSSSGSSYSGAPTVSRKESAAGMGSTSFSNVKRTISGKLATGDTAGAANLVAGVWNQLTSNQKKDIKNMGFKVSE